MSRVSSNICDITPVRRGQIIQRVLVDGWSPAEAVAVWGVAERRVARWVEAYRRRGMASLRDEPVGGGLARRWRALTARISAAVYGELGAQSTRCIVLRRGCDSHDPRPDPDRRALWN